MELVDEAHRDILEGLWEMRSRESSAEVGGECFEVRYDRESVGKALEMFDHAFESKNTAGVRISVCQLIDVVNRCEYIPVELNDALQGSSFIQKLIASFDSECDDLILAGLTFIAHLVMKDDSFGIFLHKHGFLSTFLNVLNTGKFADVLFLIFGSIESDEIVCEFRNPILRNISSALNANGVKMRTIFGALYCCKRYSLDYVDEGFISSVLSPFRTIILTILRDSDRKSIEALENVMECLKSWCQSLTAVRLLNENQFSTFLFQILPFCPGTVIPTALTVLSNLIAELGDQETQQLNTCVDLAWLLDQLRQEKDEIFVAVLDLLSVLIKKFQGFVRVLIDSGLVDIITSRLETLRFPSKRGVAILLHAMITDETNDNVLMPLLDPCIITMLLDLHEVEESHAIGTLARFHAMSFDIPEIHALISDVIEQ